MLNFRINHLLSRFNFVQRIIVEITFDCYIFKKINSLFGRKN